MDSAVRNAALQRGLAPLDNAPEMGKLLENLAAASLHSLGQHTGQRLFHWREDKQEVDLILDDHVRPLAFEIAQSADHSRSALLALMNLHERFVGGAWLVEPDATLTQPEASTSGVGTVPLDLFLVAVGRQAEQALQTRLGVRAT